MAVDRRRGYWNRERDQEGVGAMEKNEVMALVASLMPQIVNQ